MTDSELYEFLNKNINAINDHIISDLNYSNKDDYVFKKIVPRKHSSRFYKYAFEYESTNPTTIHEVTVFISKRLTIYSPSNSLNTINFNTFLKRLYNVSKLLNDK